MNSMDTEAVELAFRTATWGNTTETPAEWLAILSSDDDGQKQKLFQRLFLESPDAVRTIFTQEDIQRYVGNLDRPFQRAHLERRRRVWRRIYGHTSEPVPELDWWIR